MNKTLLLLLGVDVLLGLISLQTVLLWGSGMAELSEPMMVSVLRSLTVIPVLLGSGLLCELYRDTRASSRGEILLRIWLAMLLSLAALWLASRFLPWLQLETWSLVGLLLLFGTLQFLWHSSFPLLLRLPGMVQKVLIYGMGPTAEQVETLLHTMEDRYHLAGIIHPQSPVSGQAAGLTGDPENLLRQAMQQKVNKIIVSLSERRGVLPVRDMLGCKMSGIQIEDAMSFYEKATGKLLIERINPSWFIFSDGFRLTPLAILIKRGHDLLLALLGIMLLLPLWPVIALRVRVDSPGPILFRQVRVGRNEREFVLYKFRTMRQDAEQGTGAVWAKQNDPRVTRLGRLLRRTRLDETPQLFNVLKGDMSFVGPRPERPEFVRMLKEKIPYYSNRHCIKPGVTGWAQVRYPYGASIEDATEKLRYDLYYIKNFSLLLDFRIVIETLKVVLIGRGAR